jgi:hypothetical protein
MYYVREKFVVSTLVLRLDDRFIFLKFISLSYPISYRESGFCYGLTPALINMSQ